MHPHIFLINGLIHGYRGQGVGRLAIGAISMRCCPVVGYRSVKACEKSRKGQGVGKRTEVRSLALNRLELQRNAGRRAGFPNTNGTNQREKTHELGKKVRTYVSRPASVRLSPYRRSDASPCVVSVLVVPGTGRSARTRWRYRLMFPERNKLPAKMGKLFASSSFLFTATDRNAPGVEGFLRTHARQ